MYCQNYSKNEFSVKNNKSNIYYDGTIVIIGGSHNSKNNLKLVKYSQLSGNNDYKAFTVSGVCIVDGKILLGKRSSRVYSEPGHIDLVPSGGVDVLDIGEGKDIGEVALSAFNRELNEELTNVLPIRNPQLMGYLETETTREAIFMQELSIKPQIKNFEYEEIYLEDIAKLPILNNFQITALLREFLSSHLFSQLLNL